MVWNRNAGIPLYLQECRAVQNDNEEGEWEGRIRILQDRLSNIKYIIEGNSKEVDSKLERIERAQYTIEEKLNSIQENQKGIEERLGRFEEFVCKLDQRLDK
jgi:predicted  nucleic acid-binding Zn-ribbon protein